MSLSLLPEWGGISKKNTEKKCFQVHFINLKWTFKHLLFLFNAVIFKTMKKWSESISNISEIQNKKKNNTWTKKGLKMPFSLQLTVFRS